MSDSTTPPGGYPRPRTDDGARVLVERLDGLAAEVAALKTEVVAMKARQEANVTHRGALVASATVLAIFGGLGLFFLGKAEAASKDAGKEAIVLAQKTDARQDALEAFVRVQFQDWRRESKEDSAEQRAALAELKAEVRNNSRVVERSARRAVATDGGP